MSALWLLLVAPPLLLALYMWRPLHRPREISSARFFDQLTPTPSDQRRWRFTWPSPSVSLLLQLLVLALLLAALAAWPWSRPTRGEHQGLGLWLLLDTSHSMGTRQAGNTRMDLAKARAVELLQAMEERAAGGEETCLRLSSFDLERRDHYSGSDLQRARTLLAELQPHPRGTDLGLVYADLAATAEDACAGAQMVVISDRPAPSRDGAIGSGFSWLDISQPVANVGLLGVETDRSPLDGSMTQTGVRLRRWGDVPSNLVVSVRGPGGETRDYPVTAWNPDDTAQVAIQALSPGEYQLRLHPGGAYGGYDRLRLALPAGETLAVDWRLADAGLPQQLGWQQQTSKPLLRVAREQPSSDAASLWLGDAWVRSGNASVARFVSRHPLLEGVDLDNLEPRLPAATALPKEYQPVLADAEGRAWVATAEQPRRVYLPAPPTSDTEQGSEQTHLLFFNALRWLLRGLASHPEQQHIDAHGRVLNIAADEGESSHDPHSSGTPVVLLERQVAATEAPHWPWALLAAVCLLALERWHAALRGGRS